MICTVVPVEGCYILIANYCVSIVNIVCAYLPSGGNAVVFEYRVEHCTCNIDIEQIAYIVVCDVIVCQGTVIVCEDIAYISEMCLQLCFCVHCSEYWVSLDNSGIDIHRNPVCSVKLKELIWCKTCEINVGKVAYHIVCDVVRFVVDCD